MWLFNGSLLSVFPLLLLFLSVTSLSKEIEMLKEVVVTATKVPMESERLGMSVEVITAEEIERSGSTDLIDVLERVAGLNVVQTGSRGSNTNALFTRGGESDYNLVLIDGIQVSNPEGAFNFSSLTKENVDRVEIIKGPHSAIYGSDAITSVVNVITKKGSGEPSVYLSGALGAREEGSLVQEYEASFSGGDKRYGYFLSYARVSDGGILDFNNDYTNNGYTGSFNLSPDEDLKLDFTAVYRDSEFEFPTKGSGDRLDNKLDPEQFTRNKTLALGANTSYNLASWWENVFALGFAREKLNIENPKSYEGDWPYNSKTKQKRWTIDYRSNLFFDLAEEVSAVTTIGFEYENEDYDGSNRIDKSRRNRAYYFQVQFGFYERFFITAGARLDDNEKYGEEISPTASLSYLLKDYGTRLRAAVGKGIRQPMFLENFDSMWSKGNPKLKPEESLSAEVGIDQVLFNDALELRFTYFWNRFENLIEYGNFANGTNYDNIDKVKTKGLEIGGDFNLGKGVTLGANYTYLDFNRAKLIRRVKHSSSFTANYSLGDFNLNLAGIYVGDRQDTNFKTFTRVKNDGYFKADLATSYKLNLRFPYLKDARAFARVDNLFNSDYEEVFGYSSPGLNFISGLSIRL